MDTPNEIVQKKDVLDKLYKEHYETIRQLIDQRLPEYDGENPIIFSSARDSRIAVPIDVRNRVEEAIISLFENGGWMVKFSDSYDEVFLIRSRRITIQ